MSKSAMDRKRGASLSEETAPAGLSRLGSRMDQIGLRRTESGASSHAIEDEEDDDTETLIAVPRSNNGDSFDTANPDPGTYSGFSKNVPATPRSTRRPSAAGFIEANLDKFKDAIVTPATDFARYFRANENRKEGKKKAALIKRKREGFHEIPNTDVLSETRHTNKLLNFDQGIGQAEDKSVYSDPVEYNPTFPRAGGRLPTIQEEREHSRSPLIHGRAGTSPGPSWPLSDDTSHLDQDRKDIPKGLRTPELPCFANLSRSSPGLPDLKSLGQDLARYRREYRGYHTRNPARGGSFAEASNTHSSPRAASSVYSRTSIGTMDSLRLGPAARMLADESERKRRVDEAKNMAHTIASIAERTNREIPPYELLELIGKGSFGRVYKSRDNRTGELVAVKLINVEEQDLQARRSGFVEDTAIPEIRREVSTLQQLKDKQVANVNLIHDAFDFHDQLWIVSDYCTGGSVRTLMRPFQIGNREHGLPEEYIIPIARELAVAIKGIHELNIVHRDIKCTNLYITESGGIQLGDFGVVAQVQNRGDKRKTVVGTLHYMSLEVMEADFESSRGYSFEADIWAYGVTIFEMATGLPPNARVPPQHLADRIKHSPPRLEDESFSEELRDLVATCLTVDPEARPTIDTILQHPAIANSTQRYPASRLVDLIAKFKIWEHGGGSRASLWMAPRGPDGQPLSDEKDDDKANRFSGFDDWNFSTSEAFDRRISQLPDLDSNDLSFLQAPAGAGMPPGLTPLSTQNLSIAERIQQEHKQKAVNRGGDSLAALFDINNPSGYRVVQPMTPVAEPQPAPSSDLPLRNFTSDAPTRESMIEIDLNEADVGVTATSTFALHMDAVANEDTIKPVSRRTAPQEEDDDDGYIYGQLNQDNEKRDTMGWTFPRRPDPKRKTMEWRLSTAQLAEPDESEFSMGPPPVGFERDMAPGFRPGLQHTSTEPVGHFRDFSHDMRSAITSPDRSSMASMIDLDLGLADPVPRIPDAAAIVRPSTASSTATSVMTDMTSGNPFDLEDDPIQNEADRNRYSYHKQWQSDGGNIKRLSHKTMQMHARGSSLSDNDSDPAMRPNSFSMQDPPTGFSIGHDLDFSGDSNQFPNFSAFDTFGSDSIFTRPPPEVPRLGDPSYPLQPSLTGGMLPSRSREPSNEPSGPEIEFPAIEAPHPDALAESADAQLLGDELGHFLGSVEGALNSTLAALGQHAGLDDEEADNFTSDMDDESAGE